MKKNKFKKSDIEDIKKKKKMPIAPNKYTISFSCTHFNSKGELEVFDRKYDALLVEVLSTKDYVGMVVLDSHISFNTINERGKK